MAGPNAPGQLWILHYARRWGGLAVLLFKHELSRDRAFEAKLLDVVEITQVTSRPYYVKIEWAGNDAACRRVDQAGTTAMARRFGWERFELYRLYELSELRRVAEEHDCGDRWRIDV